MGIPKKSLLLIFTYLLIVSTKPSLAQIVFKELPKYEIKANDSTFLDLSAKRKIISLNGAWKVYPSEDEGQNRVPVNVPSIFTGEGELIFEKSFTISPQELNRYKMKLNFLGLNYTADISVNNIIIYRHSGGAFPFSLDLPKDIIHIDKNNILSVKLLYKLDSENTIPVKQRFLFPQDFGGILHDVYIHLIPNISISEIDISYDYNSGTNRAKINIKNRIEHKEFRKASDTLELNNQFDLKISLIKPDGSEANISNSSFELSVNKEKFIDQDIDISSPVLWSPQSPLSYIIQIQIWQKETLIDESRQSLAVYSLSADKDSLIFNGSSFTLNGVTYIPSTYDLGNLVSYNQMETDIRLIKETGFNSVRFAKSVPHPYYLTLCERYGLLAFIEMPINYIPKILAQDQNFIARSRSYLSNFLKAYKRYSAIAAVGLGGGYLASIDAHISMLHDLGGITKDNFKALVYASFAGLDLAEIENIDLYGMELFNKNIHEIQPALFDAQQTIGKGKVFISEATYIVNAGNTDGYVNEHSFEAQAKYFEGIIDYTINDSLAGYFLNTMFDYRGDYATLTGGYNEENLYQIGIIGENRETNRLSHKVIFSKLHNTENVTIPIGSKRDDSPMIFIIFGIILAILMGILVNSGRKFREDTSRALLRPYNFFADVRDQRIMSSSHTTILAIVVSAVSGLLLSNLLFYFKASPAFEKILLAFGSTELIKYVSFLSWNPLMGIVWLSLLSGALLIFIIIVVKAASFFVRNRVYLSSSYFAVIWAFLPMVLLIPFGIILYRLLDADVANIYVYILLLAFTVWIFYRLMKGIYVIYDVPAGGVYLYSILLIILASGGIILYYELNNSVVEYLMLTFNHYNMIG